MKLKCGSEAFYAILLRNTAPRCTAHEAMQCKTTSEAVDLINETLQLNYSP